MSMGPWNTEGRVGEFSIISTETCGLVPVPFLNLCSTILPPYHLEGC